MEAAGEERDEGSAGIVDGIRRLDLEGGGVTHKRLDVEQWICMPPWRQRIG